MRTVFATSFTPALDSGRAVRTYGIVRALAAHGSVDLAYGAFGAEEPDAAYRSLRGVRLHRVERPSLPARVPTYLRARLGGVPGDFARGIWPNLAASVSGFAAAGPDVRVIADGPVAAAALLPLAGRRALTYSAHNLESSFRHRLGEDGMSKRAVQRFERRLLRSYAESWMVSAVDMEGAAELAPSARLRLVPNVVDVAAIDPVPPRRGERSLLFVADLSYAPNREAADFLLEDAMPRLWASAPDLRLSLAGKGTERLRHADPRVEGQGFVADLRQLYAAAGCVAVPLLEGGGSPLKFVEALAYGVPVAATPHAAAGLDVRAGEHYVEAEPSGDAFARAVLEALEPERGNALARAGRRLAEEKYSIEALERLLAP